MKDNFEKGKKERNREKRKKARKTERERLTMKGFT